MTKEQLETYEVLDNEVQMAHNNLTAEVLLLAQMGIKRNEPVMEYVMRVENAVASINACKRELIKASGDRMDFLKTI